MINNPRYRRIIVLSPTMPTLADLPSSIKARQLSMRMAFAAVMLVMLSVIASVGATVVLWLTGHDNDRAFQDAWTMVAVLSGVIFVGFLAALCATYVPALAFVIGHRISSSSSSSASCAKPSASRYPSL